MKKPRPLLLYASLVREIQALRRDLSLASEFCPSVPKKVDDPRNDDVVGGFGYPSKYPCCGSTEDHLPSCQLSRLHDVLDKYARVRGKDNDFCTCGHLLAAHNSAEKCFGSYGHCGCRKYVGK